VNRIRKIRFRALYAAVSTAGVAVLLVAGYGLIQDHAAVPWFVLSGLTLASGYLSLKIPGVNGRVSVSDALICLTIMTFGPLPGAVTAALDAVTGSLRCRTSARRLQFMFYNGCVMAISAYAAGSAYRALYRGPGTFPAALVVLAAFYFGVNTLLVAAAAALDRSRRFFETWRRGFAWTAANYLAGTFIAGALVQISDPVRPSVLALLMIACAGMYVSAQAYVRVAAEAGQSPDHGRVSVAELPE
jgi:hypothetical protein